MAELKPVPHLYESSYVEIIASMIVVDRNIPNAAARISQFSTAEQFDVNNYDYSLVRQLGALKWLPQSINDELSVSPQGFAFVEESAIPVADSIRGFYEKIDQSMPVLSHIKAPKSLVERFADSTKRHLRFRVSAEKREIERLANVYHGLEHVSVVSSCEETGETTLYAGRLLLAAGIPLVSAIRGRWYKENYPDDSNIDKTILTSRHGPIFKQIGNLAANDSVDLFDVQNTNRG